MNQKGEHQQDPLEGRLAGRRIETGRRRVSGLNSRKKNGFLWRSSEAPLHPREAEGQKEITGEAPPRDPRCPLGRPKLPASTLGDDARRSTRDAGEARGARAARGHTEQGVAGAPGTGLRECGARGSGRCGGTGARRGRSAAGPSAARLTLAGEGRGRFHCGRGADRSDRPGNPGKRRWCLLTPERRREGVLSPQAARGVPGPEPPGPQSAPLGPVTFRPAGTRSYSPAVRLRISQSLRGRSLPPLAAAAGRGVRKDVRAPALCLRRFDVTPRVPSPPLPPFNLSPGAGRAPGGDPPPAGRGAASPALGRARLGRIEAPPGGRGAGTSGRPGAAEADTVLPGRWAPAPHRGARPGDSCSDKVGRSLKRGLHVSELCPGPNTGYFPQRTLV